MDLLHLILNNGYSPNQISGYGGLGYKPPIFGGELGIVRYDENNKPVVSTTYNGKLADYGLTIRNPIEFIIGAYNDPRATQDDRDVILDNFLKKKEATTNFQEKENTLLSSITDKAEKKRIQKLLNEMNKQNSIEVGNRIKNLGNNNKKALIKQFNDRIDIKTSGLDDRIEKYENNDSSYNKKALITAYKDQINFGLELIEKNPNVDLSSISEVMETYVEELNKLIVKGAKLKIENNALVEIPKDNDKDPWKQEKELTITGAGKAIKEYWENNEETILKTSKLNSKDINDAITEINNAKLFDDLITDNEIEQSEELSNNSVDKNTGIDYLKTVSINNEKFTKKEMNGLFTSGKNLEFGVCGVGNSNAKVLYNVRNPQMQVTDFIVDDIYLSKVKPLLEAIRAKQIRKGYKKKDIIEVPETSLGAQFCQDNIDIKNKIINEMKDYENLNYKNMFNKNIELKKIYADELKAELKDLISDYKLETKESKKKNILNVIKEYKKLLTDKNEFDKAFYMNKKYLGVAITINKWNPVEIPEEYYDEDYDRDNYVNSVEQLELVKSQQGQKFIPHMKDKYVVKLEQVGGSSDKYNELMTKYLNEDVVKGQKYQFNVTVRFSHGIAVYNYTKDDLVDNDFILGTYKTSYSHDKRNLKYNSVLIPIEKYILKK